MACPLAGQVGCPKMAAAGAATAQMPLFAVADEAQPLGAMATRLVAALDFLGQPLSADDKASVEAAVRNTDDTEATVAIQRTLDPYCLALVHINPESRVKVHRGPTKAQLVEGGWSVFALKVHNEAGVTAQLRGLSPNAASTFDSPPEELRDRWMALEMFDKQPLTPTLSGLTVEYRLVQIYSRDRGKREAKLLFDVGQGTQDIGFRNELDCLFSCRPAVPVRLQVHDEHGDPCTAAFEIRDSLGRVFPAQSKRIAPDFGFHPQIYRSDSDELRLPAGHYAIKFMRGPESLPEHRRFEITPMGTVSLTRQSVQAGEGDAGVGEGEGEGEKRLACGACDNKLCFRVKRWIDPALTGWYSGDHHIHAAGCAHYTKPSEGVHAVDMMKHCLGEDLKVGCNLTWGPCFDYQKQFFTGDDDDVTQYPYLMHYDIEVSGFGSHQSGHLCLLRLTEQIYPGGDSMDHWPTLCLNTLRWAKKQGAVCGPAHSGWGLSSGDTKELPNFVKCPFDGIGANEFIVDVTHVRPVSPALGQQEVEGLEPGSLEPAVDFLAMVDTPYVWELNIWYHTLNAGFRTRISGETDFPCIYGERVGLGRSYVRASDSAQLTYNDWCQGLREGRNYASDGYSHLMEFSINGLAMGERGGELRLGDGGGRVKVALKAAAMLGTVPDEIIAATPFSEKPYWHIERARIGKTRTVALEVLVNGYPALMTELVADGSIGSFTFDLDIARSSWVACRILPSSHTNPIFVLVGEQPIRAYRRSVEWCLQGVDTCWAQKERFIQAEEMEGARRDYEHARRVYRERLAECDPELLPPSPQMPLRELNAPL